MGARARVLVAVIILFRGFVSCECHVFYHEVLASAQLYTFPGSFTNSHESPGVAPINTFFHPIIAREVYELQSFARVDADILCPRTFVRAGSASRGARVFRVTGASPVFCLAVAHLAAGLTLLRARPEHRERLRTAAQTVGVGHILCSDSDFLINVVAAGI